jgi:PAS domain-containing protein
MKLMENFARRLQGSDIPPYDIEFISKQGEKRVGNLIGSLVKESDGTIKESILIFSDITHLKETEAKLLALNKELEETNKRLQRAYNWMRQRHHELRKQLYKEEVGFLLDREGHIAGVTEQALECFGKSWSQVIGVHLADLLGGDGAKDFQRELKQAWKGIANWITVEVITDKGSRSFDLRMVRLTGEEKRYLFALFR